MGTGLRVFLVSDDNVIKRLSVARCNRLLRGDPQERFLEYAGRRVRYAMVVLDVVDCKPVDIIRMAYSFLHFDSEGRVDLAAQKRGVRSALEVLPPVLTQSQPRQVIDARHRFARKRYRDEYIWTPSAELEAAIVEAIFGRHQG